MPLIAVALKYVEMSRKLRAQVRKALRSEMAGKAKAVLAEARAMITRGGVSAPGHPFKSQSGATKRLLGMTVTGNNAYVGFRRGKVTVDKKTGKKIRPARAVPNILEHGSRRMAPRPVLEPALERVKGHPWRSLL